MGSTQKLFTSRVPVDPTVFIGEAGRMFYNEATGELRISDGHTPGGKPSTIQTNIVTGYSNTATYALTASTATFAILSANANYAYEFNTGTVVTNSVNAENAKVVTNPAQPTITSVGTITNLTVAGVVTATNYTGGVNNNWTPTLLFATVQGGQTYTTRTGNYTQVGKKVFATFDVAVSSIGSAAGNFSMSLLGLPTPMSSNNSAGYARINTRTLATQNVVDITGQISGTGTLVSIFGTVIVSGASGSVSYRQLQASDLGNTAVFSGVMEYLAA